MPKKQTLIAWTTSPITIFFCLMGITWLGYFHTLNSPFFFDDYPFILKHPIIANLDAILQSLTHFFVPGRSLVFLSYNFNYQLHQYEVAGYHVVNIFLHGFNGFLIYLLIRRLLLDIYQRTDIELSAKRLHAIKIAAYGAAAAFVAHPLLVSAVTYLTQRSSLMLTAFFILGLLSFLKMRLYSAKQLLFWVWGGITLLCYIASFNSKEMALIWIAFPIAYEFIVCISEPKRLISFFKWAIPVILIAGFIFIGIVLIKFNGFSDNYAFTYEGEELWGIWTHLQTMFRSLIHYWKLLLLPLPEWRNVNHAFPISKTFIDPWAIAALLAHLGLFVAAWFLAKKRQILAAFGIIWFYLALSPYILIPEKALLVEYKAYLAAVGWAMLLANLLLWIQEKYKACWQLNVAIIAIVMLGVFGSWQRNLTYQNKLSIWKEAISKDPNNAKSLHNVGFAYATEYNDLDQAKYYFDKSLKANPGFVLSRVSLAKIYAAEHNYQQAMIEYGKFFYITSRYPTPALNSMVLGALSDAAIVSVEMEKYEQAIHYFKKAIAMSPNQIKTHFGLGKVFLKMNNLAEARKQLEFVLQLAPSNAETYLFLGIINVKEKKVDKAIALFQKGLRITLSNSELWYNLGVANIMKKQFFQAETAFQVVLKLVPTHKQAAEDLKYVQQKIASSDTPEPNINTSVKILTNLM